jgi:hypothetical protein
MHVRYLGSQDKIDPNEVLEDFIRLFPGRPILPRIRSINFMMFDVKCLRYLIRSSTPIKKQPSASASTLRHLSIYHTLEGGRLDEEGEGLVRDVAAFQRSNHQLGGGLEALQDFHPIPYRRYYLSGFMFQASMENAFVLPLPETADWPAYGLRRLEVTHYLRELPTFFGRVAKMRALEQLKIAIAHSGDTGEVEDKKEDIQYSVSSLEIEGRWSDLCPAINLCPSPSATAQLRSLRLYYYRAGLPPTQAAAVQVLDFPASIIPPDHLETLTIELLATREHVYERKAVVLVMNEFQPIFRYRRMVKLHLDLPYNFLLDIEFLHQLAAVMGGTLRHLVVLRAVTQWSDNDFKPVLTADDLLTVSGTIMPRLETLGLEVSYDEISSSAQRDSSVMSQLLRTLHVGVNTLPVRHIRQTAKFLKEHFPGLQFLYHHPRYDQGAVWQSVVEVNGYRRGSYGPDGGY